LNRLQQFLAELLEQHGAVVEAIEPEGLEVLSPPSLQQALHLPELVRLGFGVTLPTGAQRVSLESDWMDQLAELLGERGRWTQWLIEPENPSPGSPERILQHSLELLNATYRLQSVNPAWTRYLILRFRYTALSDEKRDGIHDLGFNLANGATLDDILAELLASVAGLRSLPALPDTILLPALWERQRLKQILDRTLPLRINHQLEPFLRGMHRRQERDLKRLYDYHSDLRREALERLAAIPSKGELTDKQQTDREREHRRLEAITREYQAKVEDLRQKYTMKLKVEWIQTLELIMPVQRCELLIKRRKGERRFYLDWNPLVRKLEQAPCEYSYTWERPREVCDEALHLISPAAHSPCSNCGKAYCRACHPQRCPKCN
jgi:hypothetical protein